MVTEIRKYDKVKRRLQLFCMLIIINNYQKMC
jgi:hypothetical protein